MLAGRLKRLLSQLPGRFCAPRAIEPSSWMTPGQPTPITGASDSLLRLAQSSRLVQHLGEAFHGVVALHVLVVAVAPELEVHDARLRQVGVLGDVELDDAGADVAAADVDGEDAVVPFQHPGRQQMRGAEQAGLVGVVADQLQLDGNVIRLEQQAGARDGQLAQPVAAKAAADHQAFGVAPRLQRAGSGE